MYNSISDNDPVEKTLFDGIHTVVIWNKIAIMQMQNSLLLESNLTIDVILDRVPRLAEVFNVHGMACVGCVFGRFHNVRDAAAAYKLDVDSLIGALLYAYETGTPPKPDND